MAFQQFEALQDDVQKFICNRSIPPLAMLGFGIGESENFRSVDKIVGNRRQIDLRTNPAFGQKDQDIATPESDPGSDPGSDPRSDPESDILFFRGDTGSVFPAGPTEEQRGFGTVLRADEA